MTTDEEVILRLTRDNERLHSVIAGHLKECSSIEVELNRADVPDGFEDGNDWDNYSTSERVKILVDSYLSSRSAASREVTTSPNI